MLERRDGNGRPVRDPRGTQSPDGRSRSRAFRLDALTALAVVQAHRPAAPFRITLPGFLVADNNPRMAGSCADASARKPLSAACPFASAPKTSQIIKLGESSRTWEPLDSCSQRIAQTLTSRESLCRPIRSGDFRQDLRRFANRSARVVATVFRACPGKDGGSRDLRRRGRDQAGRTTPSLVKLFSDALRGPSQ